MAELPNDIIQKIQLLLTPKESSQTCVLSKSWFHAWSTSPALDFNQTNFVKEMWPQKSNTKGFPDMEKAREFLGFVDKTLKRYHKQKIPIVKLRLSLTIVDPELISFVNRCLSIAVGNGVQELYLCTKPGISSPYILPQTPFLANSLAVLLLSWCKLEHFLLGNGLKCLNLRTLILEKVHLDRSMLEKLISFCPLLEAFYLWECEGLKKIEISDLHNLETFGVCTLQNQEFSIKAPDLVSFHYRNYQVEQPFSFMIGTFQTLLHVCFESANFADTFFCSLLSKLPIIEDLRLQKCNQLKRIKFSSKTLQRCSILLCDNLVEANLDVPNLRSIEYCGGPSIIPSLILKNSQSHCIIQLMLLFRPRDENFCIQNLRGIRMAQRLKIENLTVYTDASYSAILNSLLMIFCPKNLTVYRYCTNGRFKEFISETLLNSRTFWCISNDQWQHNHLKDAGIESFSDMQRKWQLLHKKALEDGYLRLAYDINSAN